MSRRRRQGLSPSLFPFLAVLVCTLGTLILLLALVAQNATTTAEQNAKAKEREQKPVAKTPTRMSKASAEILLSDELFRVQALVSVRDQQTADLEDRRDQVTHLDDHIDRLRQKLRRLNEEVEQATGASDESAISPAAVSAIQDKIEEERKKVEKLRDESSDLSPRVVIVPHKGPNGTDRRPVYIECDATGVTIWPEGSRIPLELLENSSYSANPLDAALRTVRMHAMKTYGDPIPPYPLLVVRPEGIETYGAARRAMKDWDDQFGYELVPGEVKLAFAKPDPNLKRRIDIAINTAGAQQRVRNSMSSQIANGRRSSRGGSIQRGGSVQRGGRSGGGSLPTLSAAALDRAGRANGFRQLRDNYSYRPSTSSANGTPYTQGPEIGSANRAASMGSASEVGDAGAAARRMAAQMQAAASEMRSAKGASNANNPIGSGTRNAPQLNSAMGKTFADLPPRDAQGTGQQEFDRQGRYQPGSEGHALDPRLGSKERFDSIHGARESESSANGQAPNERGEMSLNSLANGASSSAEQLAQRQDAATQDPSTSQQEASSQLNAAAGSPNGSSSYQSTSAQRNSSSKYTSSDPRASQNTQQSSTRSAESDQQMPQQIRKNMPQQMGSAQDLVKRKGREWAIPPSMAGMHGNEVIRTMRLQCYQDRFVLLAGKNEGSTEVFGIFSGDVDRATLELATALRDRIALWGPALPGGRWQPRLEVQVQPRGDMRFHQLRTLMNDSGIEIVGRESR